ncbi:MULTISPECIES: hypothetical protein [Rhodomicrobium]|uniref:hypothetical protein n=1 Tax=Rhodomicrobium TaxID=1068 RepID=UPI000B4BE4EB|nr:MULTISPECIES: hypothetical protein [Rhodomicrobium]
MSEAFVTHEEFKRLETRVSSVEQEADGEKMLSRYILNQSRQNGDDLAVLKTRMDRLESKVDRVEAELSSLRKDVTSLRGELPAIIAETMREVLREHGRR